MADSKNRRIRRKQVKERNERRGIIAPKKTPVRTVDEKTQLVRQVSETMAAFPATSRCAYLSKLFTELSRALTEKKKGKDLGVSLDCGGDVPSILVYDEQRDTAVTPEKWRENVLLEIRMDDEKRLVSSRYGTKMNVITKLNDPKKGKVLAPKRLRDVVALVHETVMKPDQYRIA